MKKHMIALNKLSSDELIARKVELRSEIDDLRRGIKTGDVQNTQVAKNKKREMARIMMLINAKPTAAEPMPEVVKEKKPAMAAVTKEKK